MIPALSSQVAIPSTCRKLEVACVVSAIGRISGYRPQSLGSVPGWICICNVARCNGSQNVVKKKTDWDVYNVIHWVVLLKSWSDCGVWSWSLTGGAEERIHHQLQRMMPALSLQLAITLTLL